jgi:hypothetical protein
LRELVAPAAPPSLAPSAPDEHAEAPGVPAAPTGSVAVPAPPYAPPPAAPTGAVPASAPGPAAIPVGGGAPAVTASGLARRVRGAQHPGATGPLAGAARSPSIRPAGALDDRQPEVDPAEIQRFLTSLAAGVQRSLSDTGRERHRESH